MSMNHWLVKQEPEAYPWSTLVRERRTAWTGVRNYQARNNLRAMKKGDPVLYYHSVSEKRVIGLAVVTGEARRDPTATEGEWVCVEIAAVKPLKKPVPLEAIRNDRILREMVLVKSSRLSVTPVSPAQFDRLLDLAETTL